MKKVIALNLTIFFLIGGLLSLFACGGGSGGSSGSSEQTGISYTGSTSQSPIDSSNAKIITYDAFSGGSTGGGFLKPGENGSISSYDLIYDIFTKTVQNTNLNKPLEKTTTSSGSYNGTCGGTVTVSSTIDDTTGSFTGTETFSNYCSLGTTINGSTDITGSYSLTSEEISMTFTATNLSISYSTESYTVSGTFSYDVSSGIITMNCYLKNNNTSKVYKLDNLSYQKITAPSVSLTTISGRIYLPDYGYVDISTLYEFEYAVGSKYPSAGTGIVTGAGNKSCKLEFISSSLCEIWADLNGDGVFEEQSFSGSSFAVAGVRGKE